MHPRVRLTIALLCATIAASSCATGDGISRAEFDALRERVAELEAERTPTTERDDDVDVLRDRQREVEQQAAEQIAREAQNERVNAAVARARERGYENRDEPWSTDTEAWLHERLEQRLTSPAATGAARGCELDDVPPPEIRCGTVACQAVWNATPELRHACFDVLMSGEPIALDADAPVYEAGGGGNDHGIVVNFVRSGHVEQELFASGFEDALAAEPRDDAWADEAETLLRMVHEDFTRHDGPPAPDGTPYCTDLAIECRTVTCRVTITETDTLRRDMGMTGSWQCIGWVNQTWRTSLLGALPADGAQRTWIVPREGHFIDDVLEL